MKKNILVVIWAVILLFFLSIIYYLKKIDSIGLLTFWILGFLVGYLGKITLQRII
ncbi:putative membrane protein [Priestia taiwanensis]|nr:putative membrane protein [Priestia taiwanensis]